jgi:hypothetical protein
MFLWFVSYDVSTHSKLSAVELQVNAAGDLCAICQEKMHAPILLRCKHIFCEDCVSEWSYLSLRSLFADDYIIFTPYFYIILMFHAFRC